VDNCTIKQVGIYAVEWGAACKRNVLQNCELTDLAAGGVKIGEMKNSDDEETLASNNVVRNCTSRTVGVCIRSGGRVDRAFAV
jgi:hypothetical protein